ncbi:MAG TPA: cytochrome b/b6 domain-containing protein [Xanthobacteraceae bacterium]
MREVSRYHPLLVSLHWTLAVLIIAALTLGVTLAAMADTAAEKIGLLALHMAGGALILVLMVIRFVVRIWTARPAAATTGHPRLDRIAPLTHYGFYVLILLMVGTGFATAILSGLNLIVFGASGAPLPPTLMIYPTFKAHVFFAALLAGFILLHVLAAIYHQFIRKDGLFGRMWFGRRASDLSMSAE